MREVFVFQTPSGSFEVTVADHEKFKAKNMILGLTPIDYEWIEARLGDRIGN